jgi:A/G-specific adenine glycosylase
LPWRSTQDPYAILVSEVMLQQTQVERVAPKYVEFLARFPTLQALAQATPAEVIRAWRPLGYNLRAVHLHQFAAEVVNNHGGMVPRDPKALRQVKGIGPYTAAAVACFAFGQDLPVLDTNVRRVLGRLFYGVAQARERELQATAAEALPAGQGPAWNQALMDLVATVCTSRHPHCPLCPLTEDCKAAPLFQQGEKRVAEAPGPYRATPPPFKGSRRYYRGRIVDELRSLESGGTVDLPTLGKALRPDFQAQDLPWLAQLLEKLAQEGLVRLHKPSPQNGLPQAVGLPE